MGKCLECEDQEASYKDPRRPPLSMGVCLCQSCWEDARNDRLDELETEVDELEEVSEEFEDISTKKFSRYRQALQSIAKYDEGSPHGEGICHYGCDCPWIAKKALSMDDED